MKLSNLNFLDDLQRMKQRIGANDVNIDYDALDSLILNSMDDFELKSKQDWQEITHDPTTGAMIDKFGNIIVVYIDDNTGSDLNTEVEELRKVHITWCQMLQKMERIGRYERYVATKNQNDFYLVQLTENRVTAPNNVVKEHRSLRPCQYCLNQTNIDGFDRNSMNARQRTEFVMKFKMKIWFAYCNDYGIGNKFVGSRKTKYTDENAPKADYTEDFDKKSRDYRSSKNWTCEQCGLDCSDKKGFLDTHHINGVKGDNRTSNFKALCKPCHGNQPMHGRYKKTTNLKVD